MDTATLVQAIEDLLEKHEIRDIDWFGWLNQRDPDPEYVGYAMWTINPPWDLMDRWNGPPPTDGQRRLTELGDELFGLMKTARFELGSALFHRVDVKPGRIDALPFDFHVLGALQAFSMATDRIRDLLIVAVGNVPRRNEEKKQFKAALARLTTAGFMRQVTELRAAMKPILAAKRLRNEAVHDLATQPGRVQREIMARDRSRSEVDVPFARESYAEMIRSAQEEDRRSSETIDRHVFDLAAVYAALAKAGALAFELEYWMRKQRGNGIPSG